jgi:hypothetical protein
VKPELRVYILEDCIINPPPQPIRSVAIPVVGLFAPKLVELAIGGVATLLKKAGEDQTVRAVGHEFANFYEAKRGSGPAGEQTNQVPARHPGCFQRRGQEEMGPE